ncbi:MAG: UvrY/SirA/GacA family response regulator transcription factor [Pseudomonadales bacterium]|nr:UvrY/SirA/GacA family response regulator transcription factor [Pseudomonadales bacterium]MCP5214674.1 UvrY/SirA/GacA family response regulator transcription factor [Pseudomonadales bacterium]MCP5303118.1 UvrY/SirA/GacA family response regulator transcription factor [Pseudomonadales bacterium]
MINTLVVDDHDLVRYGLTRILADMPHINVVGEAASGEEAVKLTRELKPDVILMDVLMPGMGGLEATRRIHHFDPEIKVIAVTACDDDVYPSRLLNAGASGYLTKGADVEEMLKAIETVHTGKRYISPDIAQKLALKSFGKASNKLPFDQLSERELQISMMIMGCNRVNEIAESLCLSPKTVNTYRYRIFNKLGINSDVELVLMAVRYGLLDASEAVSLPSSG